MASGLNNKQGLHSIITEKKLRTFYFKYFMGFFEEIRTLALHHIKRDKLLIVTNLLNLNSFENTHTQKSITNVFI